jgi:spore coat polysaccharide biosynthesis protein SpsF
MHLLGHDYLKKNKVSIIILARVGSKRLKNKALIKINKNSIIEILIKRLKNNILKKNIILCTSYKKNNKILKHIADKYQINFFRGSDKDIFKRILDCQKIFKFNHFVRITGDNPFTDLNAIKILVKEHIKNKNDYTYTNSLPIGTRSEVFSINSFRYCSKIAIDRNSSEYLTYFFKRNIFKTQNYKFKKIFKNQDLYNISIDNKNDLKLLKKILNHIDGIYCDANNLIRNLIKYSDPLKKRHNHKINLKTNKYDVRFKNNIANTILI